MIHKPHIYFYIPKVDFLEDKIPEDVDKDWKTFTRKTNNGIYAWSLQTCVRLKKAVFPVK